MIQLLTSNRQTRLTLTCLQRKHFLSLLLYTSFVTSHEHPRFDTAYDKGMIELTSRTRFRHLLLAILFTIRDYRM